MSEILASVSVVLGAEVSGFKAALADARKELKGFVQFGESLQGLGDSLTKYVSLPIAALGTAAVAASARMESLRKGLDAINVQDLGKQGVTGFEALQQAAQLTGERVQVLQDIAKAPGIGFEEAVKGDVRLRAVGISAQQSAAILKEFANAVALTGGGASELNSVTVQLGQMAAKGKVLSQDLRPVIEAAPAVSTALQKLFGTVDSETISAKLQQAGQSSSDFIKRLTEELANAPRVAGGLANQFENLGQTAIQSLAKIGDAVSRTLNLPKVFEGISNALEGLTTAFTSLSPGTQSFVIGLATAAAAVGPVLVAVGSIGAALPAIQAGFAVFGTTATAALGPIGIAAAAVAGAAVLIYENWDSLTAYFKGPNGQVFSDLASAVSDSFSALGTAISDLAQGPVGELVAGFTKLTLAFDGKVLQTAAALVTSALNIFTGQVKVVTDLLGGNFRKATDDAAASLTNILKPFKDLLGLGGVKKITSSDLVGDFGPAVEQVNYFSDALTNMGKKAGLLADLEARLKALKDAKPDLGSEAAIAASNQQIASLEAQIKRLNDLGKASTDMAKAYADVQKSFREIGNESLALGDQFNYLQARQSADQSGIKKLIDAGYSPFSQAVQRLVGDLRNLNVTLGDNTQLSLRGLAGLKDIKTPDFVVKTPPPIEPPKVLPMDLSSLAVDAEGLLQGFDRIAAAARAGGEKLTAAQENSLNRQRAFNTNMEELTSQLGNSIGPLLADFAGQLGDAFGSIVTGTASAGDALTAAFSGILSSLGSFMGDFGKQLIAIGIGKVALDTLFEGPQGGVLAIAAGVGLVALAGVAKAIGTSASSSLKSIGSGGSGVSTSIASTPRTYAPTATPAPAPAQYTVNHTVEFELHGNKMLAFLDIAETQQKRVIGRRSVR